ncbi:MAG TPA: hypothetical protein VM889_10300 [Candidatus Thermoplasmatota archaeon]|nr:hypothetical protein [Candidatus Thermoplasmatota archaeon]
MIANLWREVKGAARTLKLIGVVSLGLVVGGMTAYLAWGLFGGHVVAVWERIPLEVRELLLLGGVLVFLALTFASVTLLLRDVIGRRRAAARARETAPILEFSAGSVTAAALAEGEALPATERRFVASHRRKYVVRPKDAWGFSKRVWGEPVLFLEPTRAGDSKVQPALQLASRERVKHAKALERLKRDASQLSLLRVVVGVGKGYTSLTRAHALREDFARTPAKLRMNCFVTDAAQPLTAETPVEPVVESVKVL